MLVEINVYVVVLGWTIACWVGYKTGNSVVPKALRKKIKKLKASAIIDRALIRNLKADNLMLREKYVQEL